MGVVVNQLMGIREKGAEEVLGICGSVILHDLSGSSVAHALLTGSLIGPHL